MDENTKKKIGRSVIIAIILFIVYFVFVNSGDDDSYSSRYSDDYIHDSEYRNSVNEAASIFDEDPAVVDRKIQAVADEMNS